MLLEALLALSAAKHIQSYCSRRVLEKQYKEHVDKISKRADEAQSKVIALEERDKKSLEESKKLQDDIRISMTRVVELSESKESLQQAVTGLQNEVKVLDCKVDCLYQSVESLIQVCNDNPQDNSDRINALFEEYKKQMEAHAREKIAFQNRIEQLSKAANQLTQDSNDKSSNNGTLISFFKSNDPKVDFTGTVASSNQNDKEITHGYKKSGTTL